MKITKERKRWTRWRKLMLVAALVAPAAWWQGHIRCALFYPECSPWVDVDPMPGWKIPANPHEGKMYDYAHALRVPASLPATSGGECAGLATGNSA